VTVNCVRCGLDMEEGQHQHTYQPITVREWCNAGQGRYTPKLPERVGITYAPNYGPGFKLGEGTQYPQPEAYVAEFDNVSVVGGQGFVLADTVALFDPLFGPRAFRYSFNNSVVTTSTTELFSVSIKKASREIPEGVLVQSWFGMNYHHWLVEHLSKTMLLEDIPPTIPLLIDDRVLATPQLLEALAVVDPQHRPYIPLQYGYEYQVEHLILPSNLFGTGPDLQWGLGVEVGDVTVDREAVEYIRRRVASKGRGSRRIYIDRIPLNAPIRLRNRDEVRAVFEEFGFEVVYPAGLTFAEQRTLFSRTSVIAGESGAAMTNVLLAPESTVMICMQATHFPLQVYADLCAYGGQRSIFLVGDTDPVSGPTYQASFTYPADRLRDELARILDGI
jgi:Glycosyltransferase 61